MDRDDRTRPGPRVPVSLSLTPRKATGEEKQEVESQRSAAAEYAESDAELERQVLDVLASIRGALQADGGDIVYKGIRNGVLRVQLVNCTTCLIPDMSVKEGLERVIKSRVAGIREVETV